MTVVRPFEADLLRLLHAIFGRGPLDRAVGVILAVRSRPACLSREAVELIEETLAKGCVLKLARRDNWKRERFLRGERVVEGRLWERNSPDSMGLDFSKNSLDFLIRLVAENVGGWSAKWGPSLGKLTLGDSVLLYFVYEVFRSTNVGESLRRMPFYRSHGLCRLAFPIDFAEISDEFAPDLARWLDPSRVWVLEALQGSLASAWIDSERQRREITDPARVVAIGRELERVADAYFVAIDAVGRRDLSRFSLRVASELLGLGRSLKSWTSSLDFNGVRLADRADATRAALAPLAILERLQAWERDAREVGYFDEGYAAAQLWKSDWERFGGEELRSTARDLLRAADPLASAT